MNYKTDFRSAREDVSAEEWQTRMELADAQIYLLRLAHLIHVDLGEAVLEKMRYFAKLGSRISTAASG